MNGWILSFFGLNLNSWILLYFKSLSSIDLPFTFSVPMMNIRVWPLSPQKFIYS